MVGGNVVARWHLLLNSLDFQQLSRKPYMLAGGHTVRAAGGQHEHGCTQPYDRRI